MSRKNQFFVNSFAEEAFSGNPAAVCIVDEWPSEAGMQQIAKENNLSETAFCLCLRDDKSEPRFHIRWFTPGCEVDLCGHATLATAYVLFRHFFKEAQVLHFQSRSGELHVRKTDGFVILMDFPAYSLDKVSEASEIKAVNDVLGHVSFELFRGIDYVAVLQDAEAVKAFVPDFGRIASLPGNYNLLITARGNGKFDFVSRCFFPKEAIYEDPVTGSAHCTLGPLWSKRLGKTDLTAYQASARGGILHLTVGKDRVIVGGKAVEVHR